MMTMLLMMPTKCTCSKVSEDELLLKNDKVIKELIKELADDPD